MLVVMTVTLGLAGDAMLGRKVGELLRRQPERALFSEEVVAAADEADLVLVNLECCISARGRPWPDPAKPFFFRAPPVAAARLGDLGVDVVTLANNHALDYGQEALLDTIRHCQDVGIRCVGAGRTVDEARRPAVLDVAGTRVAVLGVADHPEDYAATARTPGIVHADLWHGIPDWLLQAVRSAGPSVVVVTPHWGPNMAAEPVPHVRAAARALGEAGATVVAGHSAHVFHGVQRLDRALVLYDLGGLIDDYAVDPHLRNDLGLFWLVTLDGQRPVQVEAVPLALDFCSTRLATADEAAWVGERLAAACAPFGLAVARHGQRLAVDLTARG